jgi:type VII secretion-associated serine protease mycosin
MHLTTLLQSMSRRARALFVCSCASVIAVTATAAPAVHAVTLTSSPPTDHFAIERTGDGSLRVLRYTGIDAPLIAAGATLLTTETDTPVEALATNDPDRRQQWALDALSFEQAWSTVPGAPVRVAVVDTGVRATHEDLAGAVLQGVDLVGTGDGRSDPNGHGTHVAGIIAARANNRRGIAGGAPRVQVLPVRVLDANGGGSSSTVAEGIIWAADHGARVINVSLGGSTASQGTRTAIQYALSKGALVLAAAGNNAQVGNAPSYPAAFPEAVAVGAIQQDQQRAPYSNHAPYVDVVAPGTNILSTWHENNSSYVYASGTSMATPYVAAEAALVASVGASLTPATVRSCIEGTVRDLGKKGNDPDYGHGLIDPRAAASCAVRERARATATGGYWTVHADGTVRAFGKARDLGELHDAEAARPIVASARTPLGDGYWMTDDLGNVFAFGAARRYGSLAGVRLNAPIVGMSATATGHGYFLLGADGGVFSFGDAHFRGSTGDMRLAAPVIDMATTPSGAGYWLVARDGGVFSFGDARFHGSTGGMRLVRPVVSLTPGPRGYWLVASDGGIFAFDVPFYGSLPGAGVHDEEHAVRIRALRDASGYYILTQAGRVFAFGSAPYLGSPASETTAPSVDFMVAR